ncbi:hypothetical protein SAMN05428945_0754 [Streptomyces sp. 2224.1]|uniref:hypothetical protein n=1 Tax=unclassified Streptomyces TaxID=2593676 RepID=UPI000897139D|nr:MULTISPECIES: hypothetical protein [unclassified Streptomyces]SEB65027.1 hypothetical protein SAMN05428945_0754 [Streptomyces sp. 2224.1]SEE45459.1 hypothetical protein SAMN05428954_2670 [Streptomyces sp. 2112.3]
MRPGRRTGRRTAAVVVLALAAAGCGIRGTSVPVDAGGAPSRVSCKAPSSPAASPSASASASSGTEAGTDAGPGSQAIVYLVCGSALAQVERAVPPSKADDPRLPTARALLHELQREPSAAEEKAGFSTALPRDVKVTEPRDGDPTDALRLSIRPDDLPSFALAQLVCTYGASPALGRTHAAVLGGPGDDTAHRYDCSADVLANPDIAENAGWGDPLSQEAEGGAPQQG